MVGYNQSRSERIVVKQKQTELLLSNSKGRLDLLRNS